MAIRTQHIHITVSEREAVEVREGARRLRLSVNELCRSLLFTSLGIVPDVPARAPGVPLTASACVAGAARAALANEVHRARARADIALRRLDEITTEIQQTQASDDHAQVIEHRVHRLERLYQTAYARHTNAETELRRALQARYVVPPAVAPPPWAGQPAPARTTRVAVELPWDETEPRRSIDAIESVFPPALMTTPIDAPPAPAPAPPAARPARECPICHGSKVLPGTASMPCALCDPAGATAAMAGVEPRDP